MDDGETTNDREEAKPTYVHAVKFYDRRGYELLQGPTSRKSSTRFQVNPYDSYIDQGHVFQICVTDL
jgi:hypothetical protein